MNSAAALARIREALGERAVATDPAEMAPSLTDWRGRYTGRALALVAPASTDEVAALVRIAGEHRVPIVPQGGNTGMVGGATPGDTGEAIVLSLRRMNAIRRLSADAGVAVVEAGVVLQILQERANEAAMRFPLTLGARGSATVGGLVSTNAGGTQVLRWGTMRELTLGVEAVLPDGSIWRGLDLLKKDNRGYDVGRLLIGAEGTLGVITAAALRLVPAVRDRAVAWVGVASPHAALALLRRMEARSSGVESFEIVPAESLRLVLAHRAQARAPLADAHPWNLLIELVASADAASELEALLADGVEAGLIDDATIATSEAQADALWQLRDSISEAQAAAGPVMPHDISVPVEGMPDFMIRAAARVTAAYPNTVVNPFGHLGDGNVHFDVRAPFGTDAASWRAGEGAAISRLVNDLVVAAGGSISAEHGIGQMKAGELVRLSDPARIAAMRRIKDALDPLGIMNPGKVLQLARGGGAA